MGKSVLLSSLVGLLLYGATFAADAPPAVQEYRTANKYFAAAQYRDALLLFKRALSAPPRNVSRSEIHTRIGDSYFHLGLYPQAKEAFRRALNEQRGPEQAQTRYWMAFSAFLSGDDAEAVREFLIIPERHPSSGMWVSTAYYWAGRAAERMGRISEAAEYYKKAGGNGKSPQGRHAIKRAEAVKRK